MLDISGTGGYSGPINPMTQWKGLPGNVKQAEQSQDTGILCPGIAHPSVGPGKSKEAESSFGNDTVVLSRDLPQETKEPHEDSWMYFKGPIGFKGRL